MPVSRQQRRVLRGVIYTLVFISFAVSTFFFSRTLFRNHKADLKVRHARLHAGMSEADICRDFGPPVDSYDAPWLNEAEIGHPLPPEGLQCKIWYLGEREFFGAYVSRDGEVFKVSGTARCDARTWIGSRIDELLE